MGDSARASAGRGAAALLICAVLAGATAAAGAGLSGGPGVVPDRTTRGPRAQTAGPIGDCSGALGASVCRVLFIGNSYTYVNRLPSAFAGLARAGGHALQTGMLARSGETLADHARSPLTAKALGSAGWNVVVLQEQSETPALAYLRETRTYPAARELARAIRARGALPMLFLTWAHRRGWAPVGLAGYARMQAALDRGYLVLARQLQIPLAPVGEAWSAAVHGPVRLRLWQRDLSHPSPRGTYLAACVFYAAIFRSSPQGLRFHPGVTEREAATMQAIAAAVVLGDRARWGLL